MDGEDHPVPEAVISLVWLDDAQAALFEKLVFVAVLLGGLGQVVPGFRTVTELKFFDGFFEKTALLQVAEPNRLAFGGFPEVSGKVLLSKRGDGQQALALIFGLLLFIGLLTLLHLDIVLPGKVAQSLGIGVLLMLHHKIYRIAGSPAAKAFINSLGGRNSE